MKNLLLIVALLITFQLSAQKIVLVSGNNSELKGVSSIDLKFVFPDDMHVGKLTQLEYIEKRMKEAEAKEKGTGERWKNMYFADRDEHFIPKFTDLFNSVLKKSGMDARENNSEAKIQMVITTTFLEPGFNVGVSSRPAYINLEIVFINLESKEEFAKYTVKKSPGTAYYDFGIRVGEAYAKAGKYFAKFLYKKKAF